MAGRFLLDTNIIVALFRQEPAVKQSFAASETVYVPAVAMGELYYGARHSPRLIAHLAQVDEFASRNTVLDCGIETARIYGNIKGRQRAKGRPIPDNDMWIAALAIEHSLTLVTRDQHFTDIEGLSRAAW